jgi:hypothetical protein
VSEIKEIKMQVFMIHEYWYDSETTFDYPKMDIYVMPQDSRDLVEYYMDQIHREEDNIKKNRLSEKLRQYYGGNCIEHITTDRAGKHTFKQSYEVAGIILI